MRNMKIYCIYLRLLQQSNIFSTRHTLQVIIKTIQKFLSNWVRSSFLYRHRMCWMCVGALIVFTCNQVLPVQGWRRKIKRHLISEIITEKLRPCSVKTLVFTFRVCLYIQSMSFHSEYVFPFRVCVYIQSMCLHSEYVFPFRVCLSIQSMCLHSEYVFTFRVCVYIQSMCFHSEYVFPFRVCVYIQSMSLHSEYVSPRMDVGSVNNCLA